MKMRLAGTLVLVLVLGVAALASASAYAGNGNGNGKNGKDDQAAPAATAGAEDHGNSANAPGQLKKDDAPALAVAAGDQVAAAASAGVKPSNDTAHDTHAAASSDQTKQYGNGKTAGEIAIQNGAAPSTVLHGPGNSQPHTAAACSGGHEVDVHALKGKRGKGCGTQPSSPPAPQPHPTPTPDPGKPGGDPAHGPTDNGGNTPAVVPSTPSAPSTPAKPKPIVSPQQGRIESASGVLSATGVIGGGTLPFTGFPIWVVVLIALALIGLGLILRRRSSASSS
jgi:hypothetical protein